MNAFTPEHGWSFLVIATGLAVLLALGYGCFALKSRVASRLVSWLLVIIIVIATHFFTLHDPAGYRMLVIILFLFVAMKVVVANEYRLASGKALTRHQWLLFALGWFGMNPRVFTRKDPNKLQQGRQLILFGLSRMGLGIVFCSLAWLGSKMLPTGNFQTVVISLFLLSGLSLFLHFGILNVNSGLLNLRHYGAYPLFKSPLRSETLAEFWGKRWNFAFVEMSAVAVYRPMSIVANANTSRWAAFAFSGVLHELAISLPVNRGYGLPSLYFVLQAFAIMLEKKINFGNKVLIHAWVLAWLILPMPILFHRYFLAGVVWPIIGYVP